MEVSSPGLDGGRERQEDNWSLSWNLHDIQTLFKALLRARLKTAINIFTDSISAILRTVPAYRQLLSMWMKAIILLTLLVAAAFYHCRLADRLHLQAIFNIWAYPEWIRRRSLIQATTRRYRPHGQSRTTKIRADGRLQVVFESSSCIYCMDEAYLSVPARAHLLPTRCARLALTETGIYKVAKNKLSDFSRDANYILGEMSRNQRQGARTDAHKEWPDYASIWGVGVVEENALPARHASLTY